MRTATVTFHTVRPVKVVAILSKQAFHATDVSSVKIDIPCGMVRFINIELKDRLGQ